jgi:hypothetical protein
MREVGGDVRVTIVSQSSSGHVFAGAGHGVLNLPELDRLPSGAHVRGYQRLLEGVTAGLRPDLVVEDTYPDRWFRGLLALRNVPRVLVLRRVDRRGLDDFHASGHLASFERIVVPHEAEDFWADGHSGVLRALAARSGRFQFCGPVFELPRSGDLAEARGRYGAGPLVVASAGAGGDHFDDAFCDRFFAAAAEVARRFAGAGRPERFVLVLGPYYRGRRPAPAANVVVVDEERRLPALLHLASVVVLRPGYNTLHETLSGPARVVVVPGESWMEDQEAHAARLVRGYDGVAAACLDDVDGLHAEVLAATGRDALRAVPARVAPAQRAVAAAILGCRPERRPQPPAVLPVVRGCTPDRALGVCRADGGGVVVGPDGSPVPSLRVWAEPAPPPERLVRDGAAVLLTPTWGPEAAGAGRWLHSYEGGRTGVLCHPLQHAAVDHGPEALTYALARGLRAEPALAVLLEASAADSGSGLPALLAGLRRWCDESGVRILDAGGLVRRLTDAALDPSRGARWV